MGPFGNSCDFERGILLLQRRYSGGKTQYIHDDRVITQKTGTVGNRNRVNSGQADLPWRYELLFFFGFLLNRFRLFLAEFAPNFSFLATPKALNVVVVPHQDQA